MFFKFYSIMFICKYFKAKTCFLLFSVLKWKTWCFFSLLAFRLVILFCHYIRYYASLNFLWAINSYCMVLYQSLMYNICITFLSFATAVQWILYRLRSCLTHSSCSTAMDLVSLLSKQKPEWTMILKPSGLLPTRPGYKVTVAIISLYRENAQAHSWWLIMT